MEDYKIIKRLGGGSFADVFLANQISTGELVAIKVLKKKYRKYEECCELRECKSLQLLCKDSLQNEKGYENIIKLKNIIFEKKAQKFSMVFEYMETDLFELMKKRSPGKLSEEEIRDITYQTLLGLYHMHKYGFFHRDMKPENLLLTGKKVKIADFGLAREIRSIPPYTEYVSTRYYRAPECILRSKNYNSPIDIWALGCIMAEMYMHPMPLFYGQNEKEVFIKICSVLGSPSSSSWVDGINQAKLIGMRIPQSTGVDLSEIILGASSEAIDLIKQMLKWNPNSRATAASLLNHPFFNGCGYDLKRVTNSNFFNEFGDVKAFNKTNRRFRPGNNNEHHNYEKAENGFEKKKDNDENSAFNKLLNDTEGFNKLLNQLKKEENEDNKYYEKNKIKNEKNFEDTFYNKLKNLNENDNRNKNIIKEEKEDSDDENKINNNSKKFSNLNTNNRYDFLDFDDEVSNNKSKFKSSIELTGKKQESNYGYLFNSSKKDSIRNIKIRDNFRKDSIRNKNIFDNQQISNNNNINRYDNLLIKKNNEKDITNIDSELNRLLLDSHNSINTNGDNYKPRRIKNSNNNIDEMFSNNLNKINFGKNNRSIGFEQKSYERLNLKPLINGGRRQGNYHGTGIESNKEPILHEDNLFSSNTNNQDYINKYGYKNNIQQPIVVKERKNINFNFKNELNQPKYGIKKDKFINYEKNNMMNPLNFGIRFPSRRKPNLFSISDKNIDFGIL
jgi:serine/threonine protein kinase